MKKSTIWRNKFDEKYNLPKNICWKVYFDEIFLTKDNLTKYSWRRTIWRNIWNFIEIYRWTLLFVKFVSPNCFFGKLVFVKLSFRQICLAKLSFRQISIRQIVLPQKFFDKLYFSSKCLLSKCPETSEK